MESTDQMEPFAGNLIPHDVVTATVEGATPIRAWCEYLKLTQAEVVARMGISESAYAQMEMEFAGSLDMTMLKQLAAALEIEVELLDF